MRAFGIVKQNREVEAKLMGEETPYTINEVAKLTGYSPQMVTRLFAPATTDHATRSGSCAVFYGFRRDFP
jgi:hypothetical protein